MKGMLSPRPLQAICWMAYDSQQLLELIYRETCITRDPTHRKCIHRIVPRNREDANSIRHDNVLSLAEDPKSRFLQSPHSIKVINSRNLRHG